MSKPLLPLLRILKPERGKTVLDYFIISFSLRFPPLKGFQEIWLPENITKHLNPPSRNPFVSILYARRKAIVKFFPRGTNLKKGNNLVRFISLTAPPKQTVENSKVYSGKSSLLGKIDVGESNK